MDSPVVTGLIRQLFRHPTCVARGPLPALATRTAPAIRHVRRCEQRRLIWGGSGNRPWRPMDGRWQQRNDINPADRSAEYAEYPMVTAFDLRAQSQRPRRVKMLLRDFIEDSLYNPHYGYFSKEAVIFSPGEPFDFLSMRDNLEFYSELGRRYTQFEDYLDETEGPNATRQLWHTPTELFRPFYGEALARYLVSNYHLQGYPYHDLIIYEMGAGRGTLMLNILDYIREVDPNVYDRTKYRIIEISGQLAQQQQRTLGTDHRGKVEIINRSIFDWNETIPSPCFFVATEVLDNFPHDGIRYDVETEEPMQAYVLIDAAGDFFEFYSHDLDPVAARYFRVRHAATGGVYQTPYSTRPLARKLRKYVPFIGNLSDLEFVPTRLMQFFDILERHFPAHRLLVSDFHELPQAIKGLNAPVVQTRYERRMVPVSTPLVHQGYFDILFPTDFRMMEAVYRAITGKLTRVFSHEDFMRNWAYVEQTQTRSGENPLLNYYQNASVFCTL